MENIADHLDDEEEIILEVMDVRSEDKELRTDLLRL